MDALHLVYNQYERRSGTLPPADVIVLLVECDIVYFSACQRAQRSLECSVSWNAMLLGKTALSTRRHLGLVPCRIYLLECALMLTAFSGFDRDVKYLQ